MKGNQITIKYQNLQGKNQSYFSNVFNIIEQGKRNLGRKRKRKLNIDIKEITDKLKELGIKLYKYDEKLVKIVAEEITVYKNIKINIKLKVGIKL